MVCLVRASKVSPCLRSPHSPLLAGLAILLLVWPACESRAPNPEEARGEADSENEGFRNEAAAHALYDRMLRKVQTADSLSYESEYRWANQDQELGHTVCRLWLKKPGYARLECRMDRKLSAVLVGDGECFWTYWPGGRPQFPGEDAKEYARTASKAYLRQQVPATRFSIAHQTMWFGTGMHMLVIEPSVLHGYADPMQPYLDGVRGLGTEKLSGEECDLLEASFMQGQRVRRFWVCRSDRLPRKLEQVVRLAGQEVTTTERWNSVRLNQEIPAHRFSWKPPSDWTEIRIPSLESGLLVPGTAAPLFDLASVDGERVRLADYRGKVVYLVFWRAG